jgi:gamma-glutamylcyclotransferase (GGCT)/AIG2-like uncharacterized protein YtfP
MQHENLFVYGTLLKEVGHPMADFLARRARHLGPAKTAGRLYELGPYPGMVSPQAPNEWVQGEVYELADTAATLAALDEYESLGTDPPLFARQRGVVTLASGDTVDAWLYLYRGPMERARLIASGDYRAGRTGDSGAGK